MAAPLFTVTIAVNQGADFTNNWFFATPDASTSNLFNQMTYVNFTGYGARMQARVAQDPTSLQLVALTSNANGGIVFSSAAFPNGPAAPAFNNGFSLTITKAQTLAMTNAGRFFYDLIMDAPNGTSIVWMAGDFIVNGTVTR